MNDATARFLLYLSRLNYAEIDKDDMGRELWDAIEGAKELLKEARPKEGMSILDKKVQNQGFARAFTEDGFVIDVMESISSAMEQEGVSRAELARRLGSSRANVTQMLRGRNISIRTMASVAFALGRTPTARLTMKEEA